jgi:biotin operon repressor
MNQTELIFYITHHYGKIPRSKLAKRLGMAKVALNNLIYEHGIHIPTRKKRGKKLIKSLQNRRAYEKRKENAK